MHWPAFLLFASDATLVGLAGAALLALAALALVGEHHRQRRKRIDAVGWVPWTALFIACAVSGIGLLTAAVRGWLGGG